MCKDIFKQRTNKQYVTYGQWPGDGWNCPGYGHTERRNEGRKRIRRAARRTLKQDLNTQLCSTC